MATTIQLDESLKKKLDHIKLHERETYNDLIKRLVLLHSIVKKRNQYDEFLHKIQQPKMKELWDNPEDEAWEHV